MWCGSGCSGHLGHGPVTTGAGSHAGETQCGSGYR